MARRDIGGPYSCLLASPGVAVFTGMRVQVIMFLVAIYTLVFIFTNGGGLILLVVLLVGVGLYAFVIWGTSRNADVQAAFRKIDASTKNSTAKGKRAAPRSKSKKSGKASASKLLATKQALKPVFMLPPSGSQHSIEEALANLPRNIRQQSGSLFYTGRDAFLAPSAIYVLGLNPGGDPDEQNANTVERAIAAWKSAPAQWSAYQDDSWEGAAPGTWGMQPRVLHLFKGLSLDPRSVPASNVIFVRSTTESTLSADKDGLIAGCWSVHHAVIQQLGVKAIICFGLTAGKWVRKQVGADTAIGEFRETNARHWKSQAHENVDGFKVITLTHPGRADWRNPDADPTPFVKSILAQGIMG